MRVRRRGGRPTGREQSYDMLRQVQSMATQHLRWSFRGRRRTTRRVLLRAVPSSKPQEAACRHEAWRQAMGGSIATVGS